MNQHDQKKEKWEEEFDKKITNYEPVGWWLYAGMDGDIDIEKVRTFIQSLLSQQRKELVEGIRPIIEGLPYEWVGPDGYPYTPDDIINLIQGKDNS